MRFLWLIIFYLLSVFRLPSPTVKPTPISYTYPKTDFRYPLDLPPSTAGAFGEIRPNHFHSGLDFKTNQQEGYPVYAVADGYISRLRIQLGGFGNAVYINHPNGYTSVYAHLQRFTPAIKQTIIDYQYQQETFVVDFKLPDIEIPVKKGDIIAWSGNTGSSAGPHLHFEIRDTQTEETINAQLFGLKIPDQVNPTISGLYIYKLNGKPFSEQTTKIALPVTVIGGGYALKQDQVIQIDNGSALGIATFDKNSASNNTNGPYSINLFQDDKLIYSAVWNRFYFDHSKAVNAHIDYPTYISSGKVIRKSFVEPGDPLGIYNKEAGNGLINLPDDEIHTLKYEVADIAGNTSRLEIKVKRGLSSVTEQPISAQANETIFYYNKVNEFNFEAAKVIIKPGVLYNTINLEHTESPKPVGGFSKVYNLQNKFTPVHDAFDLWIKPEAALAEELRAKAVITSTSGRVFESNYDGGYVKASINVFGSFFLKADTVPPKITPLNISDRKSMKSASKILMGISDNLSGIKTFKGRIDGNWVLMEYNPKTRTLKHTFDERTLPGEHVFSLEVTDMKSNTSIYSVNFSL